MTAPVTDASPTTAVPQAPGAAPVELIAGTELTTPIGGGVESLIPVSAPFRTNAPPWYSPAGSVWSELGCAVPQPGTQLQTNNGVIYDFVHTVGRALFDVLWKQPDRLLERWPSYDCLWEIHQLLTIGRNRLVAKTTPAGASPLKPTHAVPAPKMFVVFPVPLYGQLGCVNQYLREFTELSLMLCSEAMQHADNALSFYVTPGFFSTVYPYIQYLLKDLATKFFGVDPTVAGALDYVIPTTAWTAFNPRAGSVSFESTATLPPLNLSAPPASDLQRICGLTLEQVVPFLQPWPDAQYQFSTGGIWKNASSPASDTSRAGKTPNLATHANRSLFAGSGPPQPA